MKKDRFWIRYGHDGRVVALYRLTSPDMYFQRLENGKWLDAYDVYMRVTQDVEIDEIDTKQAEAAIKSMS